MYDTFIYTSYDRLWSAQKQMLYKGLRFESFKLTWEKELSEHLFFIFCIAVLFV